MKHPKIAPELKDRFDFFQKNSAPSLIDNLGIEVTEISKDIVKGTMPVDARTIQPFGILHGGASVALAETLASVAAWFNIDRETSSLCGLEINANHIRPVTKGHVLGQATPVHVGTSTQVWSIEISSEEGKLVCISRCTLTTAISKDKIPALKNK